MIWQFCLIYYWLPFTLIIMMYELSISTSCFDFTSFLFLDLVMWLNIFWIFLAVDQLLRDDEMWLDLWLDGSNNKSFPQSHVIVF